MQKQKPAYNHPLELERLTTSAQKVIGCQSKKPRTRPSKSIEIEIRLNPTIFLLLIQVSLRPRSPRKTSVIEAVKNAI